MGHCVWEAAKRRVRRVRVGARSLQPWESSHKERRGEGRKDKEQMKGVQMEQMEAVQYAMLAGQIAKHVEQQVYVVQGNGLCLCL